MGRYKILVGILACLLASPAFANDTMATLQAGGLVPRTSAAVAMEAEDLHISTQQISIKYVFRNRSGRDLSATVAFPLPELSGGMLENVPINLPQDSSDNFVDFKVFDGGKEIATKLEIRATNNGRDVTRILNAAGLSGTVLPPVLARETARLTDQQRATLEKHKLLYCEKANAEGRQPCSPVWTMHAQYYWTQHFPADRAVMLSQTYRPVVGGSYLMPGNDGTDNVKPYCGDVETLHRIAAARANYHDADNGAYLYENVLRYVLTTGNNWRGPIKDFKLTVTTADADSIFTSCFPGLKQVSPTRYEAAHKDFRPRQELELLILSKSP